MNSAASKFGHRRNKTIADSSYRPFVILDCPFCQYYAGQDGFASIVVADVGARGDFDPLWQVLGRKCVQLGFEPDAEEFERLRRMYQDSRNHLFVNCALSDRNGSQTLFITDDPSASSLYEPNMNYFNRLPDPKPNSVASMVLVETSRLDDCDLPVKRGDIDVMKLDVQGAELDVLTGGIETLREGVLAVTAELMFGEHYLGQPLFAEADQFLRNEGFMLMDIDMRRWRRRRLPERFNHLRMGYVSYADVLYMRDPIGNPGRCRFDLRIPEKLLKLIALSERFSQVDYGLELVDFCRKQNCLDGALLDRASELLLANEILEYNDRTRIPKTAG